MTMQQFRLWVGLRGVDERETRAVQVVGKFFDLAMLVVAFWLPIQWYLQIKHLIPESVAMTADWFVWVAFVAEALVMTALVDKKWLYLRTNWLNLVIILVSFPLIWVHFPFLATLRVLRVFMIVRVLIPWVDISFLVLSRNHLGTTLVIVVVVTCLGGLLLASFDPGIPDLSAGVWWAWETVSSVGYGDYVPVTNAGRLLAVFIMLMGVAIFSLLTANLSAFLIKGEKNKGPYDEEMMQLMHELYRKVDELQQQVHVLEVKQEGCGKNGE